MSSKSVPIILCGRRKEVGDVVTEHLAPEYAVIKFITSNEQGIAEIPPLLRDQKAAAVVTGGGYGDADVEEMRAAVSPDAKAVPWLRPDTTKSRPSPGPEYARAVAQRVREKMGELLAEGKEPEGGVQWY